MLKSRATAAIYWICSKCGSGQYDEDTLEDDGMAERSDVICCPNCHEDNLVFMEK